MEYIFLNQFSSGESFEITASDGIVTIRTLSGERKLGRQMSLEFLYQIRRLSIEGWDDVYYPSEVSGTEANAFLFDDTGWELIYKTEGKMEHHISGQGGYPKEWHFFLSLLDFFRGEHPQEFSSEMNSGLPAVFNKMETAAIEEMIKYAKKEKDAGLAMEDADDDTKHQMLVNLLMQLQRLDFQLSSKLDAAGGGKRLRLEDVKSASIQYNAALDWLDCFLTDAADRDLYRTATDIYKKVFVMYYLNSERGCLVQRAAGTEAHVMRRSSAQWRSFEEAGIGEPEGRRIFSEAELICRRDAEEIEDMWNFISMQQNLNADAAGYLGQIWIN